MNIKRGQIIGVDIGYTITQGFPTWSAFAYLKGYI